MGEPDIIPARTPPPTANINKYKYSTVQLSRNESDSRLTRLYEVRRHRWHNVMFAADLAWYMKTALYDDDYSAILKRQNLLMVPIGVIVRAGQGQS